MLPGGRSQGAPLLARLLQLHRLRRAADFPDAASAGAAPAVDRSARQRSARIDPSLAPSGGRWHPHRQPLRQPRQRARLGGRGRPEPGECRRGCCAVGARHRRGHRRDAANLARAPRLRFSLAVLRAHHVDRLQRRTRRGAQGARRRRRAARVRLPHGAPARRARTCRCAQATTPSPCTPSRRTSATTGICWSSRARTAWRRRTRKPRRSPSARSAASAISPPTCARASLSSSTAPGHCSWPRRSQSARCPSSARRPTSRTTRSPTKGSSSRSCSRPARR
mmetsp:Transcript_9551/g.22306  ORF Transcript_9551/g.22306 Transcript_9551/m.22306 type:complete len:280 (-) Transcript_9551:318-1157(-)